MCTEIYGGLDEEADQHLLKQFQVENNEMVLEKDITFYSMCEHHLMPFYGKAHVAYIPDGKVTGLSKLARTVDVYARRPQIQDPPRFPREEDGWLLLLLLCLPLKKQPP